VLLVIFGAGASFDSVPSRPPAQRLDERPPLASELFADRTLFTHIMTRFPDFIPLVPALRNPPNTVSVEGMLQRFQEEANDYPVRHRQLAAIRFYLHVVMLECQGQWHNIAKGITNYAALLDQIGLWRGRGGYEQTCLVTFNYDTLLEESLRFVSLNIGSLPDYIKDDAYKLIKVHGSMNWSRDVSAPGIVGIQNKSSMEVARELIANAATLELSDMYRIASSNPIGTVELQNGTRIPTFPALAIPVETKSTFACPDDHLQVLRDCIPRITKVLIIGWRGVEAHVVELLRGMKQARGISGVIVSGSDAAANEVAVRLQQLDVVWRPFHAGFTEWATSDAVTRFLRG
jgi:hypothetical protein